MQAYAEKYPSISVLQIDAHSDLRAAYNGNPYSHASVMHRIHDMGLNLVQVGIRAQCIEESNLIKSSDNINTWYAHDLWDNDVWIDDCIDKLGDVVYVTIDADGPLLDVLERFGEMPLPPYITEALAEQERYQTVFSERPASAAAPTAGLHLTPEVLARCANRGIGRADVELVVGLGTFRPIATDRIEDHVMHGETFRVPQETLDACARTKANGGRVVAVGTTAVRALESAAAFGVNEGRTELFIHGDYDFAVVDRMMTNFHLPKSSLIVMIDAFVGSRWRDLYADALRDGYRFLSFGDAMLLSRR
jgi:S-adenosylmethionine:tRNA ribosyltransferase-isomerase